MAQVATAYADDAAAAREPLLSRIAGRLMLLHGWRRGLAAFAAGAVGALAQPPFDFFAAGFISFPILVFLLDGAAGDAPRRRLGRLRVFFAVGWWFGFGYFLASLWWIGNAMLVDVQKYAWAMPIAVLVLPAFLACYYGLAAALARPLWNEGFGRFAAFAAALALMEWVRVFALSGFPWGAVGYAVMPIPMLMQSVTLIGMMGVNALAAFAFMLPAALASRRGGGWSLALLFILASAHVGFGMFRLAQELPGGRTLLVRMIQPSVQQAEKWDANKRDGIFRSYLDMSSAPPAAEGTRPQLILWPETSVPFLFQQRPDALAAIDAMLQPGQTLLAGAVRMEGDSPQSPSARFYNSVVAIDAGGQIFGAADKQFLVPLGEFLPFADLLARFGITKLVELPGGFTPGTARPSIEVADNVRAVPFICYEVIFPDVAVGTDADLLVNVTNDAWFGNSPGPYQHLRQAQLRAVEAGLPTVRAANNGITAVIDPYGRVLAGLALDAVAVLDYAVPLHRGDGLRLPRHDYAGWAVLALLFIVAVAGRLRQRAN